MKKIVLLGLLLLLFSACQKHEDEVAPDDLPDARLNKVLTDYKALLTGAEHGWKAVLRTDTDVVYHFLFKFAPNERVVMASDINAATVAPVESSYRLIAMQQPALIFDTHSYLHILSDPDPRKSGGEGNEGQLSDFEFTFESATPETITLTGQYHGSKLVLTKATAAEGANYIGNIVAQVVAWEGLGTFTTYFKRLAVGAKSYDIQVNMISRTIVFTYFVGERSNIFTTKFSYSDEGLVLTDPFSHEGLTISLLKGLQFSAGSNSLSFTINNEAATIREAARPVKVDVQGARDFYNSATGDDYWVAVSGFTINGVPDALQVSSLPDFYFLALWPKFGNSNGVIYDLLGFVKLDASGSGPQIVYGPAAASRVTTDGRIVYNYLGLLGTLPPQEESIVTATRQIWAEAQGFWVMRTGNGSADLVSAKDGKAWLPVFQ